MPRNTLIRQNRKEVFLCQACGPPVSPLNGGGQIRNHRLRCLRRIHIDILPGDRRRRCEKCGFLRISRIGEDDNEDQLFMLAASPLSQLPYPSSVALDSHKGFCRLGGVS